MTTMPHIHTAPGQYDFTASAFIVRIDQNEPKIVLHMHKKLKTLMQPGGHVELNEHPWQAVLHEIQEETGYALEQLKVLQPKTRLRSLSSPALHPYPACVSSHPFGSDSMHSHTDISFAFIASGAPLGGVAEGEQDDIRFVTRKELLSMTGEEVNLTVKDISLFVLKTCVNEWEAVELSEFES